MNKNNENKNITVESDADGYASRVLRHDVLKKGVAGFIASALFALAAEAIFPSNNP